MLTNHPHTTLYLPSSKTLLIHIVILKGLGIFKKTSEKYELYGMFFLIGLANKGINSFKSVTEESVLDVFSSDGKICRSYNFKYTVEFAFKMCLPFYGDGICSKMLSYLPALPHVKKNVQYLTKEEMWSINQCLRKTLHFLCKTKQFAYWHFTRYEK